MGVTRYSAEFKYEAVGQVLERGYSVKEVANNLGVSVHSLYIWIKKDLPTYVNIEVTKFFVL
jgi:transposase